MSDQRVLDRRGFLKGSALFATVAGLSAALPAAAQSAGGQEPTQPAPAEEQKPAEKPAAPAETKKSELVDKNGREFRVCDMCGGNMYLEEKRWTCDQCGFSYEA